MSNQSKAYDFRVKVLILGETGVGKTCLMLRLWDNSFTDSYPSTTGIDFKAKTMEVDDKKVKVQIWDTAGQERYRTIMPSCYHDAMGIVLCYSVNDRDSFMNFEDWVNQIKEHASERACKILIGNKCDMPDRVVSYEEGKRLAESLGMQFFETSAKEGLNVEDAFRCIAKEVKDRLEKEGEISTLYGGHRLAVTPKRDTKNSGCC